MLDEAALNGLYRYSLSLSNNEAVAYDLVQDAIEYYLKRAKDVTSPLAYIRQTIRSRYIDQLRRKKRFHEEEWDDNVSNTLKIDLHGLDKILIERDFLDRIWNEINHFERELLHLWALEGYTAQEIADHLQIPRGTVLSKIHRLRKKLTSLVDRPNVIPIRGKTS